MREMRRYFVYFLYVVCYGKPENIIKIFSPTPQIFDILTQKE